MEMSCQVLLKTKLGEQVHRNPLYTSLAPEWVGDGCDLSRTITLYLHQILEKNVKI